MRTSVDIPDGLFREAKAAASLRGETLRALLLRALRAELGAGQAEKMTRVKLPLVKSREKTYDVSPERLAAVMGEEDRELLAGH